MPIATRVPKELVVVYLYDPVPLSKFNLDPIRNQTAFSGVGSVEEGIFLLSPEKKVRATIQTSRLEYTDENEEGFESRELATLCDLWQHLPPLCVKAFGVNVNMRQTMEGRPNSGEFIRDKFLAGAREMEQMLSRPIIGTATRIVYGEAHEYFDLRITPLELAGVAGAPLHVQLHYHKDVQLTDAERLTQETQQAVGATLGELVRLDHFLWLE
jgi:hypothetical protein